MGSPSVSGKSVQLLTLFSPIPQPKEVLNGKTGDSQPLRDHCSLKQYPGLYIGSTFGLVWSLHKESGTRVEDSYDKLRF